MKTDDYIIHLKLRKKAIQEKLTDLLLSSDKLVKVNANDPNFYETTKLRNELKEINNKLDFLINIKRGMIKNENNRIKKT